MLGRYLWNFVGSAANPKGENSMSDTSERSILLRSQNEFFELEWSKIVKTVSFDSANKIARNLGHTSWRLPTVHELMSLWDYKTGTPLPCFKSMSNLWFWTSVPYFKEPEFIWIGIFADGSLFKMNRISCCNAIFVRNVTS